MKPCTACGAPLSNRAKSCSRCGEQFEEPALALTAPDPSLRKRESRLRRRFKVNVYSAVVTFSVIGFSIGVYAGFKKESLAYGFAFALGGAIVGAAWGWLLGFVGFLEEGAR